MLDRTFSIPAGQSRLIVVALQSDEYPTYTDEGGSQWNDILTWEVTPASGTPLSGNVDVNSRHSAWDNGIELNGYDPVCVEVFHTLTAPPGAPMTVAVHLTAKNISDDIRPSTVMVGVLKAAFVDKVPSYALDQGGDSDNFFLREKDVSGNPDHENLHIYYSLGLAGLPVSDVKVKVYKGESSTPELTVDGEKNAGGSYKTGDGLHIKWTPEIDNLPEDHPGFYRLQLVVSVEGQGSPVLETSIADADSSTPGWQCPQDGLAVHDLVWKHRPAIFIHSEEFSGPAQAEVMLDRADLLHDVLLFPVIDVNAPVAQAGLTAHNSNSYYLQYSGTSAQQDAARTRAPTSSERAVYYRVIYVSGANFVYLQSWHFEPSSFGISGPDYLSNSDNLSFTHDADWEMCQTVIRCLDSSSTINNKAQWLKGFSVSASQHFRGQTLRWDDVGNDSGVRDQDYVGKTGFYRPNIYIANRTHATYFRANTAFYFAIDPGPCLAYEVAPADYQRDDYTGNSPFTYQLTRLSGTILENWAGNWSTQGVIPNLKSPLFRESWGRNMLTNPRGFNNRFLKSGSDNPGDPAFIP